MAKNVYSKDPINFLQDFGPFVISPLGNFFISGYHNEAIIVGLYTFHVLGKVKVRGKITAMAISPDGKTFVTACQTKIPINMGQNTVIFDTWDISLDWSSPPTHVKTWDGNHTNSVCELAIFKKPDGDIIIASGVKDGKMRVWSNEGLYMHMRDFTDKRHMDRVVSLKFCPRENDLYIISSSKDVRIWCHKSKSCIAILKHKGSPCIFQISTDGQWLFTYGSNEIVDIWDMKTFQKMGVVKLEEPSFALCTIGPVSVFAKSISKFISDPHESQFFSHTPNLSYLFITLSGAGKVSVWNSKTRMKLFSLHCPVVDIDVTSLIIIENGCEGLLFLTKDCQFILCDVQDSKELFLKKRLVGLTGPLKDFKFAGDNDQYLVVAPTCYENIRRYNLESMSRCSYLNIYNKEVKNTEIISSFDCLTINGKSLIVTASDFIVRLFDIQNEQFVEVGYGDSVEELEFTQVVFSRNRGNFFITGCKAPISYIWTFDLENLTSGSTCKLSPKLLIGNKRSPTGSLISVAISPDDKVVCFGSSDSNVYVGSWKKLEGNEEGIPGGDSVIQLVAPFEAHVEAVTSVDFYAKGCEALFILSVAGTEIRMWMVSNGKPLYLLTRGATIQRALFMPLNNAIYVVFADTNTGLLQIWSVDIINLVLCDVELNLELELENHHKDNTQIISVELGRKSNDIVTLHYSKGVDGYYSAFLYNWNIAEKLKKSIMQ